MRLSILRPLWSEREEQHVADKHYLEAELEDRIRDDPNVWDFIRKSSLDGVWFWDIENPEHEWMSEEFWETLGYDPGTKKHLADEWQDIIFKEDRDLAVANLTAHIEDGSKPYDQVVRYRNGAGHTTWIRCRGLALRDETGKAIRVLGAHMDLTDLVSDAQLRETAFEESNQRLNAVLDAAQSGIIGLSDEGQVVFLNPRARHMLGGISDVLPCDWPEEITFLDIENMSPLEASQDPVQRALAGQALTGETSVMSRKNNVDPRYVRVSSKPVAEGGRSDVGTVVVIDDVSEHEKNRQQIERSSRLDALGQLTGGIAHDFNNLLATIEYSVQLASTEQSPVKMNTYLKTALSSVRRGADLTQRLLAFAKRQPGLSKSGFVPSFIDEFAGLVSPTIEAQIELMFETDASELWVFCDHGQLENALLNLVLNSRDAIIRHGVGSKIVVKVRGVAEIEADSILRSEDPHTYIAKGLHTDHEAAHAQADGMAYRYVEFAVTDNGPGMPEEIKRRAIDPFFTTKNTNSGTGLGLSMVYGFIQQSSGEMRIYSEVGHGTTVRLLLPRGTPTGTREEPVERVPVPAGHGQCILVVEDEQNLLAMMTELMQSLGYRVIPAKSGREALAQVQKGLEFDLLLTDIVMPGGIGGFALAREVRELRPNVPVLYMSGYTGFSDSEMGSVVAPLIQKPSPPTELATALRDAFTERN